MDYFVEFESLKFKNILTFKGEQEVPLKDQGIISVIGINKDTGSSNGSGKSTIFDIMRAIHIGSSSDGTKDIHFMSNPNPSYMGYVASYGKDKYEITKYRNDKFFKNNTLVFKNKKAIGAKKNTNDIKKAISENYVKVPEAVWDNCVVLRTDKAHTLINGSPSERIEFLSNLCQLNYYDSIYEDLKQELHKVTEKIDNLRESEALYADVSKSISESSSKEDLQKSIDKLKTTSKKYKSLYDSLSEKIKSCEKRMGLVSSILTISNDLDKYKFSGSSEKIKSQLSEYKKELSSVSEKSDSYNKNVSYLQEYEKILNKVRDNTDKDFSYKKSTKKLKQVRSELLSLEKQLDLAKEYKVQKKKLQKYSDLPKLKVIESKLEQYKQELSRVKLMLTLTEHKYDNCPVCKRAFKPGYELSIDKDSLRKEESSLKEKVEKYSTYKDKKREEKELKERIDKIKKYKYKEILDTLNTLKEKEKSLSKAISNHERLSSYRERLSELKGKIKSFDIDELNRKIKQSKDKKEELLESISYNTYIFNKLEELESLESSSGISRDKAETFLKEVYSKLEKLTSKKDRVNDKVNKVYSKLGKEQEALSSVTSLLSKKESLEKKLEVLPELNKEKQFLSNLCYAYSFNGLKVLKIAKILKALKIKLQEYISVLFSEKDISFDVKGDNRSFSIMCVRKDSTGKEIARYDVKRLSGGEKARFVLAVIFAIDDITYPNMKVNFKVLDEVDARLDQEGKRVLVEKFIPMLRSKVNTLLIVSHDAEVRNSDIYDGKLIVTKDKSCSSLNYKKCKINMRGH